MQRNNSFNRNVESTFIANESKLYFNLANSENNPDISLSDKRLKKNFENLQKSYLWSTKIFNYFKGICTKCLEYELNILNL